jgi:hypothetical protein
MMKAQKRKVAIFLALIALTWSAVPARSAPAPERRAIIDFKFHGLEADGGASSLDPTGCINSEVSVVAVVEPGTQKDGGPRFVYVFTNSFNLCTPQQLSSGFGSLAISPEQFTVDKSLGTAMLKVTVPVLDSISGNTTSFDIDLSWTALSEPEETRMISHETSFDGTELFSHSSGTTRDASISGNVSDGSLNFDGSSFSGQIQSVKEGQLTLTAR